MQVVPGWEVQAIRRGASGKLVDAVILAQTNTAGNVS
jgi:hypothetical protein